MKISSIRITQKAITLLLAVVTIAALYGCQMTGDLSGRPAIQATALTENEKSLLAALVGSSTGTLRGPAIIFNESEGGIEALAQYEAAYVLTVVFHEENQ